MVARVRLPFRWVCPNFSEIKLTYYGFFRQDDGPQGRSPLSLTLQWVRFAILVFFWPKAATSTPPQSRSRTREGRSPWARVLWPHCNRSSAHRKAPGRQWPAMAGVTDSFRRDPLLPRSSGNRQREPSPSRKFPLHSKPYWYYLYVNRWPGLRITGTLFSWGS